MSRSLLDLREVTCTQPDAALLGVSLQVEANSMNVITGDASCGLFVRVASLLEAPSAGEVCFEGEPTAALDEAGRTALRSLRCGFVFPAPYLLPGMSVIENVAVPLFKLLGVDAREARDRTEGALAFVGLPPSEADVATLDCFDQRRVALARALAHRPALLVVDHADAGLSAPECARLLALVRQAREVFGVAALVALDAASLVAQDRLVHFAEGRLVTDRVVTPAECLPFS